MADKVSGRRVRGAKLGMTVQPKKPGPFDKLGKIMEQGAEEENKLELRGQRLAGRAAAKAQGKIPKAKPDFRKRGVRA